MIKPSNFDGEIFAQKYNLDPIKDFYDDGKGNIVCPSLPNLTDADLLNCIAYPPPTEIIFDMPIKAPDFIVASPKPKTNPKEALIEALGEARKPHGTSKSIALIVLDLMEYIDDLEKRVDKLEKK